MALPSITGIDASGPMSPRPSTRVPSVSTQMVFARLVCSNDFSGWAWMSLHGAATPGVYQMAKSLKSRMQHLGTTWYLPL